MNNLPTKTEIFNGIYNGMSYAVYNIPNLIKNIFKIILRIDQQDRDPIIYIIVVILVIVQIILFINTILYYTKYLHNDSNNDPPLFKKYPVFEYLKNDNFMEIDAFFLKYNSPFPYIFIWYPSLIVIYLIYSKYSKFTKINDF